MSNRWLFPRLDFSTPICVVGSWPALNKAVDFQDDGNFRYKAKLILPIDEAATLKAVIDQQMAAACEDWQKKNNKKVKGENLPYEILLNADGEEDRIQFNTSNNLERKNRSDFKPRYFDTQGVPIPQAEVPHIGTASRIRVNGKMTATYVPASGMFVSLKLEEIQVVEAKDEDAPAKGFGSVDGGYTYSKDDTDDGTQDSEVETTTTGGEDF